MEQAVLEVCGELDFHAALHFIGGDAENLLQNIGKRESAVTQYMGESYGFRPLPGRGVHDALVLVVVGGYHF